MAPCATDQQEVVTNGWSPSKRNNPWSNSGIVTEIRYDDIPEFHQFGPLAGLEFQKYVEQKSWKIAGSSQKVPAQRLVDFVDGKLSSARLYNGDLRRTKKESDAQRLPHVGGRHRTASGLLHSTGDSRARTTTIPAVPIGQQKRFGTSPAAKKNKTQSRCLSTTCVQ